MRLKLGLGNVSAAVKCAPAIERGAVLVMVALGSKWECWAHYGNEAQNRLVITIDPLGREAMTKYNSRGKIWTTTDALKRVTAIVCNVSRSSFEAIHPGYTAAAGLAYDYTYTEQNRLKELELSVSSTVRRGNAYELGATGRRTQVTETVETTPRRRVEYSYDTSTDTEMVLPKVYRMTQESILSPSGQTWVPQGHAQYVHDEVGNRLSRTVSNVAALANQTLQYDNLDRVDSNAVKTDANSWYDANGNTVARGTTDVYDAENRLITRGNISIAYDHEGNRVRKTVNGVTTLYLVDTLNPTGYGQVIAEFASGTSDALKVYAYGNDLISMRLPQQGPTGTVYYYGYDGQGSVRMLFDAANAEIESYDYDAYGTIIAQTAAPVENVYLYTGEQWDPSLGMYYLRARYYGETEGRFWTKDSYEGAPEEPGSLHKYVYCEADPINSVDPSGLFSNWIYGREVHRRIGLDFTGAFGGSAGTRYSSQPISSILDIHWRPGTTASQPDLVEAQTITGSGVVYEIKPVGSYLQGRTQLQFYLGTLNALDPLQRRWREGTPAEYAPRELFRSQVVITRWLIRR